MTSFLIYLGTIIIAYFLGNFSAARFVAKTFRHLKVCKIGTGRPDTENIYFNVSKSLGILVGTLDFLKVFISLTLVEYLFRYFDTMSKYSTPNYIFVIAVAMILGHVFPIIHKFYGGRGIFHYIAVVTFFAFYPMIITGIVIVLVMIFFKQFRFSQFMIVILPPLINLFFNGTKDVAVRLILLILIMGLINVISSKQKGEL